MFNVQCCQLTTMYVYQVIFSNGDGALQVLPRLLDIIPEARLNLVSSNFSIEYVIL